MPEMSKKVVPPSMGDANPSEKILKLGQKITDVVPHKISGLKSTDPEYWGLADVISEEMATVALTMKVRTPYTFPELCKMNNIAKEEEEKFQTLLDEMSYIGLLEYDYGYHYDHNGRTAPLGDRRYILPLFVPGSAELLNMEEHPEDHINHRIAEHPEIASFFERMTFVPLAGLTQMIPMGGAGVGMHVIPVEKAIEMENTSVDLEHLSYWLKKYEGHIGVGQCSCRISRQALGEGCGDDEQAWCIGVGDFADYCRETGKGHDITYDEAMAILKKAEQNGFVHQITNIDGENKIFGICNCNVNICNALRTSQLFNTPNLSRSAYTAEVDPKNCVACGRCVEVCPAGAVKLGQKLCTKDGPVKYPQFPLPDKFRWPKEMWNENYRDDNRINCYDTGTAPCKTACPAHVAVQGYLKMASQGRYRDALALIKKENPFPAICGRVCNKRCETACTRGTVDKPVAIDAVKKFIAEQDLNAETRYVPDVVMPVSPMALRKIDRYEEKIAIIGAGPAGLSCAYYLAVRGYKPTVFEKNHRAGGMMTYGIPSYKLEKDVVDAEIDVLRELGVDIRCDVEVGKDVTIEGLRKEGYKAFYLAIGCQGARLPNIPNETAKGTTTAVEFLHNATENQSTILSGNVVVVGGGNVAVDCARTAHRFRADNVKMFCLESRESMPASKEEVAETLEENIEICNGWGPKEILTDADGHVSEIVFKKCLRTVDPETKMFSPVYDENETMSVKADHIIFAIGQSVAWGNLLDGCNVTLGRGGRPVADKLTYQTSEKDIFVGGDLYTGPAFVIDAIAQGHEAAESLHRFVKVNTSLTIGRNRRQFIALDKDNLAIDSYDHAGRQEAGMDEQINVGESFRDAHLTLTEEQVKTETARCLSCGASVVDTNRCLGCGVCTTRCEFDAIHLHRTHPEATHMIKAEDKVKELLPYMLKRALKILFAKKTKEEKEAYAREKAKGAERLKQAEQENGQHA